jgi:GDPmannose 4,6-dehydratase
VLIGDSSRARNVLGWSPSVDFVSLVKEMVCEDLELAASPGSARSVASMHQ